MIKVFTRSENEAFGLPLGEFPPSVIDDLVNLAKLYPCHYGEDTGDFLQAQFVSDSEYHKTAFFEIVFGKD